MIMLAFEWVLFSTAVLKGKVGTWISWTTGGFGLAILLANVITPVTKLIFYIDESNLYHRGSYIALNWAYVYACQLFPILLMSSSEVDKREKRAIALYPLFPLIASVIQIAFYGVSTGQVGATMSIILIYVVLQGREINDNRRAQERLEIESELAKSANEAKSNFLASMSHEIRTPINAVLGMDTMILRESKDDNIREYAMNIYTASNTLLALINDILDFSKIESGKMDIEPVQYDFATLLGDVFNMIRIKAEVKGLQTVIDVDSSLPSGLIGDDVRIRQILLNIMGNAVKYSDEGGIRLTVSGEREEDRVNLHFSVKDTGIGIKEEDIGRLFDDYERVTELRNRSVEGTGLGLSITAKLLNLMGSELKVKSVYGEGSDFYFDLVQQISDYSRLGDMTARIRQKAEEFSYQSAFTAPEAYVLVVDDNKMNRDVFCGLIKETGVVIDQAASGLEALELIDKNSYDIVFLDHMMPDMDGIEVLEHIREKRPKEEDASVYVALTANALSGSKEYYVGAGFDDYMSKPIIPEMLENMLRRYIPEDKLIKSDNPELSMAEIKSSEDKEVREELPMVEGIDWNYAMLHYRSSEALEDAIKTFYNMIAVEAEELSYYFNKLKDDNDDASALSNYRIKVHAMKNEANLIGGYFLGGSAASLEYASRDGNIGQVLDVTPYFLDSWNSYRSKLKLLSFLTDSSDKQSIEGHQDEVRDLLTRLNDAMQAFDVHGADDVMKEIDEYQFPESLEEDMSRLKGYVSNLDSDNAEILINKLMEEIANI